MSVLSRTASPPIAPGIFAAVLCVALRALQPAAADAVTDTGADQVETRSAALVAPTLGRPAFVAPGSKLTIVVSLPDGAGRPSIHLGRGDPQLEYELLPWPETDSRAAGVLHARVPANVPPGTYDLIVTGAGQAALVARHCVRVGRVEPRVRLVHLSNFNIGDPTASEFDPLLPGEINLLNPTLIVATGDYFDALARPDDAAWAELVEFFAGFDAPALIACGDHDNLELYARQVAPSPAGLVELGDLRGVVLFDTPSRPLSDDPAQVSWLERTLAAPGEERVAFVVAHDECPNLLRVWQQRGVLAEMLRTTRLGLYFAGGHRDWDGREYAELVAAADPLMFVRTHQASTATREGADGRSHYRVIDVEGGRVWNPGRGSEEGRVLPPSMAVGRLNLSMTGPNDGTAERVSFTAVNRHPFRCEALAARVLLAKGPHPPWCRGAELQRTSDLGSCWECLVGFDLPEKGHLRATLGTGPPPAELPVGVAISADTLTFVPEQTSAGLSYLRRLEGTILVELENLGEVTIEISPLLRLDGEALRYQVVDGPADSASKRSTGPPAPVYSLRIAAGQSLWLKSEPNALRITPGRHELQVYIETPESCRAACQAVEVLTRPSELP